jgi:hypothetical protein
VIDSDDDGDSATAKLKGSGPPPEESTPTKKPAPATTSTNFQWFEPKEIRGLPPVIISAPQEVTAPSQYEEPEEPTPSKVVAQSLDHYNNIVKHKADYQERKGKDGFGPC